MIGAGQSNDATAPADALGDEPDGACAGGSDRVVGQHGDAVAISTSGAGCTECRLGRRGQRGGAITGHEEAGKAAAARDRLGHNTVRLYAAGRDGSVIVQSHRAGVAAEATGAAERHGHRGRGKIPRNLC
ncbi:MAG: hypothetical protein B7Z52_03450 [Burkholderiales bacterium 12-64-5]|nr:MAG: hypothetical protein B7Z52_03450 [Burkholderiales bacterium 12-64-5]